MRERKAVSVWASRIAAMLLALVYLALVIPSIMPRGWPANRYLTVEADGRDPWLMAGHIGLISVVAACIWLGQRRSRVLEGVGWAVLSFLLLVAIGVVEVMLRA